MRRPNAEQFHAVKFYASSDSLCRVVAEFLGEGLVMQQPALVMATPEHRERIAAELRLRHFDLESLEDSGSLVMWDAAACLASLTVDGMPTADAFNERIGPVVERMRRHRSSEVIRVYGEMVDLLWRSGHEEAAIQFEALGTLLARDGDFKVLCGYATGNIYRESGVSDIHRQHSHVVGNDGLCTHAIQTTFEHLAASGSPVYPVRRRRR